MLDHRPTQTCINVHRICEKTCLLRGTVVWFRGAVARPGVRHSDGTAGAAMASGGASAEQRVEEGMSGLGHEDHEEGHRLQDIGRGRNFSKFN